MSGGSYDYTCYKVEDTYSGKMFDVELDEMVLDLSNLLHDLEWWQSGDINENDYRKTVQEFKNKWFGTRDNNLRRLIQQEFDKFKERISLL
jgi:hypothetical protein